MKYFYSIIFYFSIISGSAQDLLQFNFDTIEPVYIDTSLSNNIWQIGIPQKIYFNSALSGNKTILTDTINYYPANNVSEFTIITPTYSPSWGGVHFYMNSKYDMDSLVDGGAVYVSFNGIDYNNIIDSQINYFFGETFSYTYTMDTIASLNDVGFTGKSNGWVTSYAYWSHPAKDSISGFGSADSIWIKFRFKSDGIDNNREGWMIDSIYFSYDLGIGINEVSKENLLAIYPNPASSEITIASSIPNSSGTIVNSFGQIVKSFNFGTRFAKVSISDLDRGFYIVNIGSHAERFIISDK